MAIFVPLKERAQALKSALGQSRVLPLPQAAAAMDAGEKRLPALLMRMNRRDLFGANCPYCDFENGLVVLDPRFSLNAELVGALHAVRAAAAEALKELSNLEDPALGRAQAVGTFVRKLGRAARSGLARDVLLDETGSLVRSLISPSAAQAEAVTRCRHTLISLDSLCGEVLPHAGALSLSAEARELASSAHALQRALSELTLGLRAGRIQRLASEVEQQFRRRAAAFRLNASAPEDGNEALLRDLSAQREALRVRAELLHTRRAREALVVIDTLLHDILALLRHLDASLHTSAVRSLRLCYLPMARELVEKLLQHELQPAPDAAAAYAMERAVSVLERDIPEAFRAIFNDLRESSAIDLEAQSEALRRKLQLDGLIDGM